MDSEKRKELKNAYRNRQMTGGICCLKCSGNQRSLIQATRDTESLRNRFNFAMKMKTFPDPQMYDEWKMYGSESFSFTVLEEIKKREDQTEKEFAEDIDVLYEMWLEKSKQGEM